ncbi:hypothetical protein GGX14DRAFT_572801 [Mycena pura]|uniref:Uncharacterized protein n=1 Tax=Mycena pura TaxID=153505 RepID=A0AAD6V114_9AGAR|nr:hypothetical protein GGX14DRAFT_572801 [Mycena pura]
MSRLRMTDVIVRGVENSHVTPYSPSTTFRPRAQISQRIFTQHYSRVYAWDLTWMSSLAALSLLRACSKSGWRTAGAPINGAEVAADLKPARQSRHQSLLYAVVAQRRVLLRTHALVAYPSYLPPLTTFECPYPCRATSVSNGVCVDVAALTPQHSSVYPAPHSTHPYIRACVFHREFARPCIHLNFASGSCAERLHTTLFAAQLQEVTRVCRQVGTGGKLAEHAHCRQCM